MIKKFSKILINVFWRFIFFFKEEIYKNFCHATLEVEQKRNQYWNSRAIVYNFIFLIFYRLGVTSR